MRDWTQEVESYWDEPAPPKAAFWPVRLDKFLVLTVLTLGFYPVIWFWRNWRAIEAAEPGSVVPIARTFFSGIFYFSLVGRAEVTGGVLLAFGYVISNVLYRLPDNWWLLGWTSVLFLVPTVLKINAITRGAIRPSSSDWRKRDAIVPFTTGPIVLAVVAGLLMPGYVVERGSEMDEQDLFTLWRADILAEDEEILFFYANDPWAIDDNGALISDLGLTCWWNDPVTEKLVVAYMPYGNIVEVDANYADHWFEDTWVRVTDFNGDWLHFPLSNEEDRDKMFVGELRSRASEAPPTTPAGDV